MQEVQIGWPEARIRDEHDEAGGSKSREQTKSRTVTPFKEWLQDMSWAGGGGLREKVGIGDIEEDFMHWY